MEGRAFGKAVAGISSSSGTLGRPDENELDDGSEGDEEEEEDEDKDDEEKVVVADMEVGRVAEVVERLGEEGAVLTEA